MNNKRICDECNWYGTLEEILRAPNPFEPEHELWGCPRCKEAGRFLVACDESGCLEPASCGTPTPDGYRQTCGKHRP